MPVPFGTFPVAVTETGYALFSTSVTLVGPSRLDISLTRDFTGCTTGTLSGVVTDAAAGTLKAGITVRLDTGATATTGLTSGSYAFSSVPAGYRTISVTWSGYIPYNQKVAVCGNTAFDIGLISSTIPLGPTYPSGKSADPVNTATGNYVYQRRDLELPGIGMPLQLRPRLQLPRGQRTRQPTAAARLRLDPQLHMRAWPRTPAASSPSPGATATPRPTPRTAAAATRPSTASSTPSPTTATAPSPSRSATARSTTSTASGRLTAITDKNGNTLDARPTPAPTSPRSPTPPGASSPSTTTPSGRITLITDPIGRTVQYSYDANGDLIEATDPNGNLTQYTYDAEHQILTVVDPRGNTVVSNTYDADQPRRHLPDRRQGQPHQLRLPGARPHHHHHRCARQRHRAPPRRAAAPGQGRRRPRRRRALRLRRPRQPHPGHRQERQPHPVRLRRRAATSRARPTRWATSPTITYDADDNPLSRTDALGNVTQFAYDANGNLTQTTDALGNVATISYTANGLPRDRHRPATATSPPTPTTPRATSIQVTDALGNITSYSYDGVGRRLTATDALGRVTSYATTPTTTC